MEMTHWSKSSTLVHTQNLVKRFDGRFVCNPVNHYKERHLITLTFEDVENANKFCLFERILEQPFV